MFPVYGRTIGLGLTVARISISACMPLGVPRTMQFMNAHRHKHTSTHMQEAGEHDASSEWWARQPRRNPCTWLYTSSAMCCWASLVFTIATIVQLEWISKKMMKQTTHVYVIDLLPNSHTWICRIITDQWPAVSASHGWENCSRWGGSRSCLGAEFEWWAYH